MKLQPKLKFKDIAEGFDYGVSAEAVPFDGINQYIRITDITESGKFDKSKLSSPSKGLEHKFKVNENDILLARTGASVGKSYLYDKCDGDMYFAGFLIRMHITKLDSYYVKSYLQTDNYWNQVKLMSARSGQPGINSNEYRNFQLPSINKDNSTTIGQFLSQIDNLITKQENKITSIKKYQSFILNIIFNEKFLGNIGTVKKLKDIAVCKKSSHSMNTLKIKCTGFPVFDANKKVGYLDDYDNKDEYISYFKGWGWSRKTSL